MEEAVTHYINSHPSDEVVHIDANNLALNVQDDAGGRVAVMHSQTFSASMCRQVSVGDHVTEGQWGEELLDPDSRLAVIMAHITAQSRLPLQLHQKVQPVRNDVDTSVILDNSIRLFSGQTLDDTTLVADPDGLSLAGESPAQNKQSKKSLPHKKRISRKLKKNSDNSPPHPVELNNDIVVISCADEGQHEEILPDNFVSTVPHADHIPDHAHGHHIPHEVQMRPILICQLCGDFYGEDQLKFFHHLKQHYEPHIIIENPVTDLGIDKMTNSCIVDNTAQLPDSIVELSLENSVPKTIYQPMDKHVLYNNEKPLVFTNNRVQYSIASIEKESVPNEVEKADLYETLDKLDMFSCGKCNKSFKKQKQYETHMKDAHNNNKVGLQLCDMGEFSEPEDLMEGIHVSVEEAPYEHSLLPHLTVENGHAHQHSPRHWYGRGGWTYCGCGSRDKQEPQHLKVLKEEVLQRILETDVANDTGAFTDNIITSDHLHEPPPDLADARDVTIRDGTEVRDETNVRDELEMRDEMEVRDGTDGDSQEAKPQISSDSTCNSNSNNKKKEAKRFECKSCSRVFRHRNSLMYHALSHGAKTQRCRDCGKAFYTPGALKIHRRVHNGDKPYKCDVCGREFRQWNDLKNHKVSIHTNQKIYKCEFCNKEFARKYSLNVHRKIHTGEKNYKCEYCTKTFRTSSYRASHMRTHTGDRPHKCELCEKSFRAGADLRRHLLTHDKVRNRTNEQKLKLNKDQKDPKDKKPIKLEIEVPKTIKKIAVASTTKMAIPKPIEKKSPPKNQNSKKNAQIKKIVPNITIDQIDKSYTDNVEVFDTKFKEVYNPNFNKDEIEFGKQIIEYKSEQTDERDLAILRPMFRNHVLCDNGDVHEKVFRNENTDGKMAVFTNVEKSNSPLTTPISINDMRHLEPRTEITEGENGFLERLTALYNISAV